MRCKACDAILTDFESTIKFTNSGDFLDLCGKCRAYVSTDVDTTERYELYNPDVDVLDYDTLTEGDDRPTTTLSDDDGEAKI